MNISPMGLFSSPDFGVPDLPSAQMPLRLDLDLPPKLDLNFSVSPDFGPAPMMPRFDFQLPGAEPMPRSLDFHVPALPLSPPSLNLGLNNLQSGLGTTTPAGANPSWGRNLFHAAIPPAAVIGMTHAPIQLLPAGVRNQVGHFVLVNHQNPADSVWFGANVRHRQQVNLPGLGKVGVGVSAVGTAGVDFSDGGSLTFEAGPGVAMKGQIPFLARKVPIDFFEWANFRAGDEIALDAARLVAGKPALQDYTGSFNFGGAVSLSDALFQGASHFRMPGFLNALNRVKYLDKLQPTINALGDTAQAVADAAGVDVWGGAGWRGSADWKGGKLVSLNFDNHKIDVRGLTQAQIAEKLFNEFTPFDITKLGSQALVNGVFRETPGSSRLIFAPPGSPGYFNNAPSLGPGYLDGNIVSGANTYKLF